MLGPFVLNEPIGKGGMAVVWAGQHATRGTPVAIKIMKGSTQAHAHRLWRREVRAVASLDHPRVVRVLDVGQLPPSVVSLGLTPGAPYLVMERAQTTLGRPTSGRSLRATLLQLLDALAHAHARGIVHLDIKATNVLVGGARPGVRLSDFGLARAWREGEGENTLGSRGTPSHMAPEQLEAGEVGPWTDLYALGVLGWRLATGQRPYKARSILEAAVAMTKPLPPFLPDRKVPPGFEAWLRAMMQRDPELRFRRAADAAWALLQLGGPDAWRGEVEAPAAPAPAPDAVTLIYDTPQDTVTPSPAASDPRALRPHPPPLPRLPATPIPPEPLDLAGAGVGLFALRDVGLVGREADQAWLWDQVRWVDAQRQPRLLSLHAPPGAGASRLARWLCERTHELGGGEILVARHGPAPEPGHGVGPMLAAAFRVARLAPAAVAERLHLAGLDRIDARGLAAVLRPDQAEHPVRSPTERHRLVEAGLRCLAARRTLVLWLDDIGHDADTIALALHLERARDLPVLVLATGAPADLVPRAQQRHLDVLSAEAIETVVRRSLGLTPAVVEAVVRRAGGSPRFALELLAWLVTAEKLRASPRGLAAPRSVLDALPSDLQGAYRAHVDAVAPGATDALRLAALLGSHVPETEWAAGCLSLGLSRSDDDLDALLRGGLLRTVPGGYTFGHEDLRRAMAQGDDAVATRWHRTLAAIVDSPERQAHHLLAAHEPAAAIQPLAEAAREAQAQGASRRAEQLLRRQLEALDASGAPANDLRRGTVLLLLQRSQRVRGAWDDARSGARDLLAQARAQDWARHVGNALVELAMDRQNAGALNEARTYLDEAYASAGPHTGTRAAAALRLSLLTMDTGDATVAAAMAREALSFYRADDRPEEDDRHWNDDIGAGYAHVVIGRTLLRSGDIEEGLAELDRAYEAFDHAGERLAIADALNYRAGAFLAAGRITEAEGPFREALAHYEALGAWTAILVRINLAVLAIDTGRPQEARPVLETALRQLEAEGRAAFVAAVQVFLLPCLVHDGEQQRFEQVAEEAQAGLASTGFVDSDLARIAARAATDAEERGWPGTIARVIATTQREKLGGS